MITQKIHFVIFLLFVAMITYQSLPVFAQNLEINLIDDEHMWLPFSAAFVSQNSSGLNIVSSINYNGTLFNRAYLPTEIISDSNESVIFELQYSSNSYSGNAAFIAEIRDNGTDQVLWNKFLNNTDGQLVNKTIRLDPEILNKPIEFRFYIWTDGPGEHILDVKRAIVIAGNDSIPNSKS